MDNKCCENLNKNVINIFAALLLISLAAMAVFFGASAWNKIKQSKYIGPEPINTISITETGEVFAKPDLAIVDLSVISESKNLDEALLDNTNKMNSIIDFVKSQGVQEKDMKTVNFSIYPVYDYIKEEISIYPYPPGKRVLTGYEVTQQLEVKIRDLGKAGKIIGGATEAGANEVSNLQFTIENEDGLKKEARAQATEKVKTKAKEMASQVGVNLGRITNFSENFNYPYYYGVDSLKAAPSGIGGGEISQIQTGENKITVTMSITYEIK